MSQIPDEAFRSLEIDGCCHIFGIKDEAHANEVRSELRAIARTQKWKIQTGFVPGRFVWAARPDFELSRDQMMLVALRLNEAFEKASGETGNDS